MTSILVAAAIVERDGRYLVTRRAPGAHLGGAWEFPGGKCAAGESIRDCLLRELREELDVGAVVGEEVLATAHAYDDRHVELRFLRCAISGDPSAVLGQEMRWVTPEELPSLEFPPADAELVRLLSSRTG